MADEKKIVPEPDKAATPEQLTLDKGGPLPPEKAAPVKAGVHTQKPSVENKVPISPEKKELIKPISPEKSAKQGSIISGKVVEFSTAQKETGKPTATEKKEALHTPSKKVEQKETEAKHHRGRPRLRR